MTSARKVRCPACSAQSLFHPDNPFRPFCSQRCKTTDLGAWANNEYAIPGAVIETPQYDEMVAAPTVTPPPTLQ